MTKIINTYIFSDLDGSIVTCEYEDGVFTPIEGEIVGDKYKKENLKASWDELMSDSVRIRDFRLEIIDNLPAEKIEEVKDKDGNIIYANPLVNFEVKIDDEDKLVAIFDSKESLLVQELQEKELTVTIKKS